MLSTVPATHTCCGKPATTIGSQAPTSHSTQSQHTVTTHSHSTVTAPSQHRHSTVTEANRHQSIGPQAPTSKSAPGKRGAFKEEQSVHRFVVVGLGRKYDRNGGIKPKSRLYIDYIYLLPAQHVSKLSGCGIEGSRDDVWHQDLHGWTKPKPRDVKIKE